MCDSQEHEPSTSGNMPRHKRNLAILCCALLCNQATYITLESLQSTLNQSKGTIALALLYVCFVISSMLLPPWVIARIGCKRTIAISIFSYGGYTAANFYPRQFTLVPTAMVAGIAAGLLWSAVAIYVIRLSAKQAQFCNLDADNVTEQYFGILWTVVHFAMLVGSSIITILIFSISSDDENESAIETQSLTSSYNASTFTTLNSSATPENCELNRNESCGLMHGVDENCNKSLVTISPLALYLFLGSCLVINSVGAILCKFLNDYPEEDITNNSSDKEEKIESETSVHRVTAIYSLSEKLEETSTDEQDSTRKVKQNEVGVNAKTFNEAAVKRAGIQSSNHGENQQISLTLPQSYPEIPHNKKNKITQEGNNLDVLNDLAVDSTHQIRDPTLGNRTTLLLKAVISLLADRTALLLILHTINIGMLQVVIRGSFNGNWIGCRLGLRYVSPVMIANAAVTMVSSYGSGKLLLKINHSTLFASTLAMELSVLIALLLWEPSTELWPYFVLSSGLGFSHSVLRTQTPSAYVRFFPQQKKESAALQVAIQQIGVAVMFGVSSVVYPLHVIIIVIVTACLGYILFLVAAFTASKK